MAAQSASFVRSAALRSKALSGAGLRLRQAEPVGEAGEELAKAFSMGLKSGL